MNQSEDTFKSTNQEVEHNISNNTDRQLLLRNNVHKSCLNFELSSWNSLKLKTGRALAEARKLRDEISEKYTGV
ncbi:hypothetical protein EB796_020010 [Bugula neritina]|uniref:Uncharacterized protein n=1 Tax=Bugula neritina TaxID=10212 RepID=A0A7J7J7Y0_BUGNE|nr:hypothetical protein EB796_020010 [Bugula neritina]